MADRRMFSMKIVDSDFFKEMPLSTQALYFHLGMHADDEGFLNNAKSVQRSILASDDDMKLLIAKNYIIPFESGVIVIKHWKMQNAIQPSRLKPTQYTEERALLEVKENGAYTLASHLLTVCRQNADEMPTDCRQNVAEVSIGKNSIDKYSVGKESTEEKTDQPPAHSISAKVYSDLVSKYGKAFVDERRKRAYSDKALITFCEEDFKQKQKNNKFNNFTQRTYSLEELEDKLVSNK